MSAKKDHITVALSDQLLCTIVLEWISRNVDKDGALDLSGLPAEGIRQIRSLRLGELRQVASKAAASAISVNINRQALLQAIDETVADRERVDSLEFLIRSGATRAIISDVLGVSEDRYLDARTKIGVEAGKRGRPAMPDLFDRQRIVEQWHQLRELSKFQRLRTLHAEFGGRYSLASITAAITEFVEIEDSALR
jgi:Protein of unknown function (DUF2857)